MKKLFYWIILSIVLIIVSVIAKEAGKALFKQQVSISNPFLKTSPLHEPYQTFTEQLFAISEINQFFKKISSTDQAFVIALKMSTNGMRRLGDVSLVDRMKLVGMLFERVNVETCAVMVRGKAPQHQQFQQQFQRQFLSALEQLGVVSAKEWFDLTLKAAVAEARQYPVPAMDTQRVATAMNDLLRRLSPADSKKLETVLTNLNTSSDQAVCWAGKALYGEALKMDAANKRILARAFVSE